LNHPNIAALYGLENADGVMTLVMEFIEGADLAERIARGTAGRAGAGTELVRGPGSARAD
jgi:hypothetical protein